MMTACPPCPDRLVVGDQTYHHHVIHKFHNDIGAVCGYATIGVKGVEQRTYQKPGESELYNHS